MTLEKNEDYLALVEAVRDMVGEFRFVGHFIMNPTDAEESELPLQIDDLTGEHYIDVEGYRIYMHEDCPLGQLGACVPEGQVGIA